MADPNYFYGQALRWEQYAKSLQRDLDAEKKQHTANVAVGQAALDELKRLDPNNYLLVKENRERIYQNALKANNGSVRSGEKTD